MQNFNFQPQLAPLDFSAILEALKRRENMRNPFAVAIDKAMQGWDEGRQIAAQNEQRRGRRELESALNPQPQPTEGPVTPQGIAPAPYTPPINRNAVQSAMIKAGFGPQIAERLIQEPKPQEPMSEIWISPDMKNASMIEKPGFRKQMVPPGTIPQFMQKEEKPIIDKSMQAQIAKAKYEYAKVKPVATSISKEMDKLMELNKNSYGGLPGGMTVSILGKFDAKATDKYNNTLDLIKGMQQQVAKALKPSFGGQISEGERKYLNELYGALPGMGRVERERAMMKVKQIMETSIEDAKKTYEILSGENVGSMDRLDFGSKSVRDLSDAELEQLANGE